MGWDALHLSLLNGGSEVAIKGSETWLSSSSPFFFFFPSHFQFCISETTVAAKCGVEWD